MSTSHRFLIRLNLSRGAKEYFDVKSTNEVKRLFSVVKEEMDGRIRRVRKATTTLSIGGGPSFDTTMKRFAKSIDEKIKQRFHKSPSHWPPLSSLTVKLRGYRKDPAKFEKELFGQWYTGNTQEEFPVFSFKSKKLDPMMAAGYPTLLQTGNLKRSIHIKYIVGNEPVSMGRDRWVFRHSRKITIGQRPVPYASIQFYGGSQKIYFLSKTVQMDEAKKLSTGRDKEETRIYFPQDFLPELYAKSEVLKRGGFEIKSDWVDIPPRNPLYFDQGDLNMLGDLLDRLGSKVQTNMAGIFAEDISAFDTKTEASPGIKPMESAAEEDIF